LSTGANVTQHVTVVKIFLVVRIYDRWMSEFFSPIKLKLPVIMILSAKLPGLLF
jgi:hypothetical protein